MPPLLYGRPLRRALAMLCVASTLGASLPDTAHPRELGNRGGTSHSPQRAPQEQQERDPDERAAGDETPETYADSVGGATLLLTPSRLALGRGSKVRLTLTLLGADDLRRLPVTLRFDPEVLRIDRVGLGSAWDNDPQPVLLHDASRPGELVIGLGLLDRNAVGLSGSVELLELEFTAIGAGAAALRLEDFAAITAGSRPFPLLTSAAEVVIR